MSGLFISATVWPGGTLAFDDGSNPAETYTYNSEHNLAAATFYDVATDIVDWVNAAGRAWTGVITASMTVTTPSTPHLGIDLAFTGGTFTTTGLGGLAQAYTGWADVAAAAGVTGGNIPSTARAHVSTHHIVRQMDGKGSLCQSGSWAMSGGASIGDHRRPSCVVSMDEAQATALAVALRGAGSPRHCRVYDGINDSWVLAALGHVRARGMGTQHQRATLQLVG